MICNVGCDDMTEPSEIVLAGVVADATRAAATELFTRHPGRVYYFALISTGEALPPYVSAWSEEALAETDDPEALRWSYPEEALDRWLEEAAEPE